MSLNKNVYLSSSLCRSNRNAMHQTFDPICAFSILLMFWRKEDQRKSREANDNLGEDYGSIQDTNTQSESNNTQSA